MNLKNSLTTILLAGLMCPAMQAQRPGGPAGGQGNAPVGSVTIDTWEMRITPMNAELRTDITETVKNLKGNEEDRSLIGNVAKSVLSSTGMGIVSGLADALVSETFNLIQYRKKQKEEWRRMIQNENFYTDSITNVKTLKDFYTSNSLKGALDPSDINFDGIEIYGSRNGQEVLYMRCSIDRDKLDHLFSHSKFNLVLDTLSFFPNLCHLPNVTANGIRTMNKMKKLKATDKDKDKDKNKGKNKGKATEKGDTILRPGTGGNGFSFDERNNLQIAFDLTLLSSWINQAVQVHKDVELGNFKFTVSIPEDTTGYHYSRRQVLQMANEYSAGIDRDYYLLQNLVNIEGDSFIVPRSYMPLTDGRDMWGTGEYDIKVKIKESCDLKDSSEKAKKWKEDYKRLRQMQNKSSLVREYFTTLWNQYGNNMVKTSYKTAVSTTANGLTTPLFNSLSAGSTVNGAANTAAAANASMGAGQTGAQGGGNGSQMPPSAGGGAKP